MILTNIIEVIITEKNIRYYSRTNSNLKEGDVVSIPTNRLSENSGFKVSIKCDYCGDVFKSEYRKYLRSIKIINTNSCKKYDCVNSKTKGSNIKKYGVENVMQLDSSKRKAKKTNLDRYGTENPNDLELVKNKIKETNLERHGDHPMRLNRFKSKIKETNLERYGTENPNELELIETIQKETANLLQEAENLRILISEFEAMIR